MSIKSLIIDDNPFIIDMLRDQLELHHPDIDVVDIASNGTIGLEKIRKHNPDLIFLDVEMPDMNGFDMLSRCSKISFQTIFITSYSHYAIKAIRFNALDYLVKPIEGSELKQALKRYYKNIDQQVNQQRIQQTLRNMKVKNKEDQTLLLQTHSGELNIALKQIVKLKGDRNYTYIYLTNKTKKLSSKTLGYFEEILEDKGFFRCHRSFIVNGKHISNISNRSEFIIDTEQRIPISRRKKKEAIEWFGIVKINRNNYL